MRRNAALFVLISVLSGMGGTLVSLAAGIWIFDLTGDPGLAALAALGVYLPSLAAPWLGALVDRFPRRALLIVAEFVVTAVLLSLLAVDSAGQVWLIYLVMLVRGAGYVILDAGESALLPAALPADRLGDVNGWRSSAQEGIKLVAPLGGAALYAWAGPHPVILLSAALPLLSAGLYALLRLNAAKPQHPATPSPERTATPSLKRTATACSERTATASSERIETPRPEHTTTPRAGGPAEAWAEARAVAEGATAAEVRAGAGTEPVAEAGARVETGERRRAGLGWSSVREGLIALRVEPVRTPVLLGAVVIAVSGLTNAAVLARIVGGLDLPATYLGVLSSAQGAGSIVAGLLVGRLLARFPAGRVAGIGGLTFGVACLFWSLPWWPGMIVGSVLAGMGLVWALIAAVTAVQTGTPEHLLGRVAATSNTALFGPLAVSIPLGAALIGLGARTALLAAATLLLITVTTVWRWNRKRPAPTTVEVGEATGRGRR
ncbi:MFS transporter [Actinoplanes sp. G11-F43]|uniref:MFS transporter n=1 Tax=Actinoplanes sp. G11-F43 TaxID=3424130 RepID=UPI003D333E49